MRSLAATVILCILRRAMPSRSEMIKTLVLVTGSGGFIGQHLVQTLRAGGQPCFELMNHQDCDLTDREALTKRIAALRPEVVVHLAASPDPGERIDLYASSAENTILC